MDPLPGSLSLYFGDHLITENSILSIHDATLPVYYSIFSEPDTPTTVILLNITDDIAYWVSYISVDNIENNLIDYSPPIDAGRYLFVVFASFPSSVLDNIEEQDFTKNYQLSDFGRLLGKVGFLWKRLFK
jgi:hypothetical protein